MQSSAESSPLIGIDLGGTKLLGAAVDRATHQILTTCRFETPRGGQAIIDAIAGAVDRLAVEVDASPAAIGIGIAGLVDTDEVLRFGPNIPGVIDLDLVTALGSRFMVPIRVDNDSTCGALAELMVGSAQGVDTAIVAALGTGIGGGLIIDGRMWRGAHGMAAEFGHMLVNPDGPLCGCGQRGCWEQMASGNALGRLARSAAAEGRAESLLDLAGRSTGAGFDHVTSFHLIEAAAAGAADALGLLDEFSRWVAVGLASLVEICDPELVIIGGGLSEVGRLLLDPVEAQLNALVMGSGHRPVVPVVAASAGEAAAALGAALLAVENR